MVLEVQSWVADVLVTLNCTEPTKSLRGRIQRHTQRAKGPVLVEELGLESVMGQPERVRRKTKRKMSTKKKSSKLLNAPQAVIEGRKRNPVDMAPWKRLVILTRATPEL